ncbi:vacuole membrane protein 1 isoform X2 [Coccinella septempunctata]|uniref:vacuole membrane protein 1 isoform X2 n=1 Tax=Coccinella septempunctata TaxID=41139 RepID=UPI001D06F9A9|nr:vacuole membrane protein 1 isoform X2 [Coccinella septempunctata]
MQTSMGDHCVIEVGDSELDIVGGDAPIEIERLGYKMSASVKRKDVKEVPPTTNGSDKQLETKNSSETERLNKQKEIEYRKGIVLWKRPILTIEYCIRECLILLTTYGRRLLHNKRLLVLLMISTLFISILMNTNGPHQSLVQAANKKVLWCLYWIGLGVLSSVGLGTGLHTFLLYLGPHIARVTLAAYECNSVDFPEPPYPDDIICPTDDSSSHVSIFTIMAKVRLEAMCWGAGTALGELPPYFMARAARLSGIDPDDEDDDLKEFEELQKKAEENQELTVIQKGKLFVEDLVKKVGFFGILACASIPNPLFDLAGITCGHFLVPFWTFFGATLIGKAFIKMHIQKLFVIIAFDETLINMALGWLKVIPVVGEMLQVPFKAFLDGQKTKLHQKGAGTEASGGRNILSTCFEVFVMAMVLYFVVSILNSLAQSYHKRISKKKSDKVSKD